MKERSKLKLPRPKRFTHEQEVALIEAYRAGDVAAGNQLVEHHLRYAFAAASRMPAPRGISVEDLQQEAAIGLIRALKAWRPQEGRFIGCAFLWIRSALQLYILRNTGAVRAPMDRIGRRMGR